jgi:hypothetical protein
VSTIQTLIDRLRVRIDEATARKWADSGQLLVYCADAEVWMGDFLGRIKGSGRFRARHTWTQAASTETYALSNLSAAPFAEVIEIATQVGNEWVPLSPLMDGDDWALRNASLGGGNVLPRYTIRAETIVLLPTAAVTRPMALLYRYKPVLKTSAGTTLEVADEFLTDMVTRALHFALADAGQSNRSFEEEYAARLAEIEAQERRIWGAQTEVVRPRSTRRLFLCR